MDIHGNDPSADIFGNPRSTTWGTAADANVLGTRPTDSLGNLASENSPVHDDVLDTFLDLLGGLFGG